MVIVLQKGIEIGLQNGKHVGQCQGPINLLEVLPTEGATRWICGHQHRNAVGSQRRMNESSSGNFDVSNSAIERHKLPFAIDHVESSAIGHLIAPDHANKLPQHLKTGVFSSKNAELAA